MLKNMHRKNTKMKYTKILMMVAFRWRVKTFKIFSIIHIITFLLKIKFNLITE